ncbi:conjugal transfer protein MobC [Chitinophaga japonensis]|uniref:Type IV secretory system conjugative DNA transfer VirD4/TraG family protein n=1 Tax=Chitinophaga japonensis TaxID=104662 RepID=A0A562T2I7_CHIJA|nr:conjugal transfer protein MobC [Chitinophaga japonensis]TWI87802.1 type IV secretory system conjugative DNA transfer VirD4/TraG family protein [Chitinophaga japonensis]
MGMQTGENDQALRKILDMTRLIAITILCIHFYYYCYGAFYTWGIYSSFTDQLLGNIAATGLLRNFHLSKCWALGFLLISLLGAKGRKNEKINSRTAVAYLITGILIYFVTFPILYLSWSPVHLAMAYMSMVTIGFLLILSGGTLLTRIIKDKLEGDIFNRDNETFPQEERYLANEYSINLPARYNLKGKIRSSWINYVAIFRAILVQGSQGSGKTAFVIRHIISQLLAKPQPFTMLIYDFKFPDLSRIAYNHFLKNRHRYKKKAECIFINFDDLSRSHRGNVFDPLGMTDLTDASESARTILLGLNTEWKKNKQGDFFVESAINFVTAIIWFLRQYRNGRFCTLPHVIELMQLDYNSLFTLLRSEAGREVGTLVNPFINAYLADVMEQLEGQIASAKIALARLSSPALYYILSGNDFSLDINNPEAPKIICFGNNPQKILTYGAVLSLYVNRLLKIVNQKGKLPCALIFDEFPTLTVDIIPTISCGRSNFISVVLGIQDESQLRRDYGKEQADVIMNTIGNVVSGQVAGESAKHLSERIGKIMQDRQSMSINSGDTSISKNKQLEYAVPASKIASLSSGEFVGMVSDTPQQKIDLKAFHCEIVNDWEAINAEEKNYAEIPVIRQVDRQMVQRNFEHIKQDIQDIVQSEIEAMLNDPSKAHLVIRK